MTIYACEKDSITGETVETEHENAEAYAAHLVASDPDQEWEEVRRHIIPLSGVVIKKTNNNDFCILVWSLVNQQIAQRTCETFYNSAQLWLGK